MATTQTDRSPRAFTYLDHAATTPLRPGVLEAMAPYLEDCYANPNGSHRFARQARRALDEAREQVAELCGVRPGAVVFTSGGTESDTTALMAATGGSGAGAVCSAVEHHAVLDPVVHAGGQVVSVDSTGHVDLVALEVALTQRPDHQSEAVQFVSVMAVNNEVGRITDLSAIARRVRTHAPGAIVHCDAVQAACWLDLRDLGATVDAISLSAHKFGGPKGVGVLTWPEGRSFHPVLRGGGQERDRRSGTQNLPGIVGLAAALAATDAARAAETVRIVGLRGRLTETLHAQCTGVIETVPAALAAPGIVHLCIEGVESEALLFLLDEAGVCASAASACASGAMEPSHVLAAMGVDPRRARGALRLSLGHSTTEDDVERAVAALTAALGRLRR